jgi:pyruvate ferredoxin oxidoreductase gamma subunit
VLRSQVYRPQLLVILSEGLASAALQQGLHDRGVLLVNCTSDSGIVSSGQLDSFGSKQNDSSVCHTLPLCSVDAWGIARAYDLVLTGQPLVNIPMFGAMAKLLGLSVETVAESIANKWPRGNEPSVQAALQAYETVRGFEAPPYVDEWKGRMPA